MLNHKFYPSETNTKRLLVMLHGFISDASTFDAHIKPLNQAASILTVELPGHGQDKSNDQATWDFDFITRQLDEVLTQYRNYDITLNGYSMGGRVALYYALHGQMDLSGLILESASPGLQDEVAVTERKQVDEARARVLEIAGIEVFVNDWEKLPLFMSQAEMMTQAQRNQIRNMRLAQQPKRLAKALRDYGTGNMPNLWPSLKTLQVPVCLIVGARDQKFYELAYKMADEIPNCEVHVVNEAGHTVHVEDMEQFDIIVLGFLNKEEQNG